MAKVVKKFGGTSLKNEARINLAAREVIESLENGDEVVVVVSAMGSEGDPYATNTLIELLEDVSPEVDSRKKDLMMSCGETISASLFSHYLDSEGYASVPMTGGKAGIFTNDNFGNADIIDIDPVRINHYTAQGKPVVLAGFQGRTVQGEVTTLGRGGSDTTAMAVAKQLNADFVELYTDVPGVAVADPGIVENPRYFSRISRASLARLTENGAEIVHSSAVEKAKKSEIPIRVKCPWNGESETIVGKKSAPEGLSVGIVTNGKFTMIKGKSREINRDEFLKGKATDLIHLEGRDSLAILPNDVEGIPRNGYEKNHPVSVVSVVVTGERKPVNTREKLMSSLGDGNYLQKVVTDFGMQFMTGPGGVEPIVKEIYEVFYG